MDIGCCCTYILCLCQQILCSAGHWNYSRNWNEMPMLSFCSRWCGLCKLYHGLYLNTELYLFRLGKHTALWDPGKLQVSVDYVFLGVFFLHCVHFVLWTRLVILYFHSYEDHPINEHFVDNFYFPSALKVSDESTPCTLPVYFSPYCPFVFSATRQVPQMVDVSSDHHISGVPYSQTTFSW